MASARESICQNDPNFAVICSFLNRYGDLLGIPKISFAELQTYLEETKYGKAMFSYTMSILCTKDP